MLYLSKLLRKRMSLLWLIAALAFLAQVQYLAGAAFVPGRGCETKTPIKTRDTINANISKEELECSIVENSKSYREFYKAKYNGKWSNGFNQSKASTLYILPTALNCSALGNLTYKFNQLKVNYLIESIAHNFSQNGRTFFLWKQTYSIFFVLNVVCFIFFFIWDFFLLVSRAAFVFFGK